MLSISLQFDNGTTYLFECSDNGETITSSLEQCEPKNLGQYGETIIADLSQKPPWSRLVGAPLISIEKVLWENVEVGLSLIFSDQSLFIFNVGDMLMVDSSLSRFPDLHLKQIS